MSEIKGEYKTGNPEVDDAIEMMGKGYEHPAVIITPPVVEIAMGEEPGFIQTKTPAFVKMSTAFKKHMKKLKGAKLAIWLYIALSINDQGTAYPGIEAIMRDTGFSNREVIDSIKEIAGLGYLTVRRRSGTSSLYRIADFVAIGKDHNPTSEVTSPVKKTTGVVKKTAPTHDETSLKPDINQIVKQDCAQPLSKEKIKEITENTERRILDGLRGASVSWSGREKFPEAIRDLLDVFVTVSGIKPVAGQQHDWLKTGSDWLEIGATKPDIAKAFEESKPNEKGFGGFACYRPGSLTGAIQKVVGQRRASRVEGTRLERALAEIAEMPHG